MSPTIFFVLAVCILSCHAQGTSETSADDSTPVEKRFCNTSVSELNPDECQWPCSNMTCPPGTELAYTQDCQLPAWRRALLQGAVNVTAPPEDVNSTASPNDDLDAAQTEEDLKACQAVCSTTLQLPQCCSGFFGSDCLRCPGSSVDGQVCSGHGQCNDGYNNDGTCRCYDNFTGSACDQCSDSDVFGPNCTEACRCVNGDCDGGPQGSGNCSLCFAGFQGPLCDQEIITCDNLTCANNSRCEEVDGDAQCVCDPGYEGQPTNVTACTAVNMCEKPVSVCGPRVCVFTGPGHYLCRCPDGHLDNGIDCIPINPCRLDNGGCDAETSVCMFTGANSSMCDCLAYYENYVAGEGCSLVDVCPSANCHQNSNCSTVGPNQYRCTCLPGFVGDGVTNCFGNIMDRLKELNEGHPVLRNQLSKSIALLDNIYPRAIEDRGPFTIFVPNDRAYRKARKDFPYAAMLRQRGKSRQMIRQHILLGKMTLEDLQKFDHYYTLQGNIAELQVRVAKNVFKYRIRGHVPRAKVVVRDLPAFNGIIHVVNELLINDPNIEGDVTETAMELIREEGRFNRLQTLISNLGLESVFERDNITVFAPENGGLDDLPEGTLEYLTTEQDGKAKLRTLLENHIFPGRIPVTELIHLKQIRSIANYAFSVSVGDKGQVQLGGKANISQANIPCSNAVYYHVDGPLIPDQLADILPSRCDIIKNTTVQGRCTACDADMKCPLDTDTFYGEISQGCKYWGVLEGQYTEITGCRPFCIRSYKIPKCCPGFYGKDCKPCPGGHKNPCGGRGECSDEMFGSGFCICDTNFRGDRCEKCLDRTKFGPNCTEPCSCMHGQCNGGPSGDGLCVAGSCYASFRGENCDMELKRCPRGRLVCHLHAECVVQSDGKLRCECSRGYEGDGKVCREIDPCQKPQRGHCHSQARCTKVGPGSHLCKCEQGWFGDGFTCEPVTPCNSSDHCHEHASCINLQPGMYTCKCKKGYEGNGTICEEVDGCLTNNGGCHHLASCSSTGPGTVNCTCPDGYLGDGTRCFTTIAGHILAHDNLTLVANLIRKQDPDEVILGEIGESFTFFAPSDQAMRAFLDERVPSGYFDDPENIMAFFQFHAIAQDYTLQEMMALEGVGGHGRWETLFDGFSIRVFINNETVNVLSSQTTAARVVAGDIAGLNGHLHIIDGVLEPFLPDSEQPFLREFFEMNTRYSVFGQWLQQKGLIEKLQSMDQYTLFVPDNSVFRPDAINHTITAEYLKYYILPSILLTPAIDNNQTTPTLLGDTHLLRFTTAGTQVRVNGVKIARSNLLMMEGVVHTIAGLLHPVVNFCNKETHTTVFGVCGPCSHPEELTCEAGYRLSQSSFVQRFRCKYTITDRSGIVHKYLGCRRLCDKSVLIPQCCAGYYGTNCTECPGGPESPCSGHGLCDDTMSGTGRCLCDRLYTGISCQSCVDGAMGGPFCNISKDSCQYQNGNCSVNAECSESETGDGVHCRCRPGYVGDGYTCTSPCDTHNGGCHANATCSLQAENQTVSCTCKEGFHGNGFTCQANRDRCEDDGGGCSVYADCRYSPPPVTSEEEGEVTCGCLPGYTGNGTLCVTTVLNALSQIPSTSRLYQSLMASLEVDNITQLLGNDQSAVTVFVPIGASGTDVNINDYVVVDTLTINTDLLADTNSSGHAILSASGLPLYFAQVDGQFYIRGTLIVSRNIPAVNGYVNLLASPFLDQEGIVGTSTSASSNGLELVVILVPVCVLLLAIILVAVGVVCYRRSRATGFLDFVKTFRKGSDTSMSFARLKAQESDDDGQNPFNQPDNVNFDNPLYTDPDTL